MKNETPLNIFTIIKSTKNKQFSAEVFGRKCDPQNFPQNQQPTDPDPDRIRFLELYPSLIATQKVKSKGT